MLATPPQAGEGVHNWLFRVARQLHAHLPAVEIVRLLESRVRGCGRHVSRKEIEDAVKNALSCAWQPISNHILVPPVAKWPSVNQEQREAIVSDHGGLADLWELSRPLIEDDTANTEAVIDRLFPGNPLLCCGKFNWDFNTKSREEWRGALASLQFIVPSPMSAVTGMTRDGNVSFRSLKNTGGRRFLIVEFDPKKWSVLPDTVQEVYGNETNYESAMLDEHAALLLHLATFAPLVCTVHSGGKSLHGWFYVWGLPDAEVESFFRYAVSLGADRATWTPSQFVRMPGGMRDNGKLQTVFYTNFNSLDFTQ